MDKITCSFKEVGLLEPASIIAGERKKFGRYEGGALNVKGYGTRKWSVAAYIVPRCSIKGYLDRGMSQADVVAACIKYLNQPLTPRARKAPYGTLECRHFVFHEDKISVSLVTSEKNNKYFWGRGKKIQASPLVKRGRPRKKR